MSARLAGGGESSGQNDGSSGGAGVPAGFQHNGVQSMTALWAILGCGLLAIVYGAWAVLSIIVAIVVVRRRDV